jgi:hypothetical protein
VDFFWGLADWLKVDLDDVMVCLLSWLRAELIEIVRMSMLF